jgi:predicted dehydrogenase
MNSRRNFVKTGSLAAAGLTVLPRVGFGSAFLNSSYAPSDTMRIGAIGINGMGWSNVKAALTLPGVKLVALADIDRSVIDKRLSEMKDLKPDNGPVDAYEDYRRILDRNDIDAVIIGTPDHWHPLMTIHACQAGKHVYCEKPVANSIGECLAMEAAQKKYNKMIQVGQWQRSQKHFRDAIELVHSGKLGNIRTVKAWAYQGWMKPAPVVPNTTPPAGVNYDLWQGPAPKRPFNTSHFHFNFRWFWAYAGGLMCDWGVHLVDYALYGMKARMPKSVSAAGGKFAYPELSHETPDSQSTIYQFDDFILIWEHALAIDNGPYGRDHGIAFIGNNGTLVVDRGGWEVIEEKRAENKVLVPLQKRDDNGVVKHWENFIDAIRSNDSSKLNAPLSVGSLVAKVCQMGNVAYRSGKRLEWDRTTNLFTDKAVNKKYLMAPYENGYKLSV